MMRLGTVAMWHPKRLWALFGFAAAFWISIDLSAAWAGTTTIGIYRPSNEKFFLRNSNTYGFADLAFPIGFASPGDLPVAGDWDGNGTTTIGLYRPSTNTFYLWNSNAFGPPDLVIPFGAPGDLPIVGDWDGL